MNQELKVTVSEDQKVLIIREGDALPLKEPLVINISGDIDTVKNYVSKRHFKDDPLTKEQRAEFNKDPNAWINLQAFYAETAVVTFDKKNLSISLDTNPQDYYGVKVSGKMEISDELKPFGINQAATFNREALVKLLRFNKRFFSDFATHEDVLKAFQNLSLTGNTEIKAASDTRGNRSGQFAKTINSQNIPAHFYLTIPIFKGQPAVKFMVEICLDSSESSVIFWFESVELAEIWDQKVDEIFTDQKKLFKDFVIVNK